MPTSKSAGYRLGANEEKAAAKPSPMEKTEIAQAHEFEIISLGGGRPHMELSLIHISPRYDRILMASRTELRATPIEAASSGSGGMRSPGLRVSERRVPLSAAAFRRA